MPSYKAVPRQERVEATRHEIVAAAVHAFRVRGYTATTMSTVAAIAKVSPRTLYRYFGSKSDLFAAVTEESAAKFINELFENVHRLPLRDAIIESVERTDNALTAESREMMRLAAADEKAWRHFLAAANSAQTTVAGALRAASDPAQLPNAEAGDSLIWEVRASAVLGAVTTAYRRWATTDGHPLPVLVAKGIDAVLPVVVPPGVDATGAQSAEGPRFNRTI
ncbi:TetR/AcrR family transcriptional regulator [Mycobacterium sp. E3247]|uniref:TetR/AcrR family transcriptional regulator n=1 Tax=Mycobacterium sp. E3247 TaxID=1856864 RepID=UPI0018D306A4|nr:TetR/AcrR family transcriptional regulator [Mycobacterium sp. E3247]